MATKRTPEEIAALKAQANAKAAALRASRAGKPGYGPSGYPKRSTAKAPSGFKTAAKTMIKTEGIRILGDAFPTFKRTMEAPPTFPKVTPALEKARALFGDEEAPPAVKREAAATVERFEKTRAERLQELAQWNLEQEQIAARNAELKARIRAAKAALAAGQ